MFPQRATAGLRRTTPELTDSNHDSNNPVDNSSTPTQTENQVAMEISSSSLLTDTERNNLFSCHTQEVEKLQYPEVPGVEEGEAEGEIGKRDGDECDYLVFEIGEQKGREGVSNSDGQDKEEGGNEGEGGERGETEGKDEERGEIDTDLDNRGIVEGEDGSKCITESGVWGRREIEGRDEGKVETAGEDNESGDAAKGDTQAENEGRGEAVEEVKEDALSELLCISDSPPCPLSSDHLEQPAAAMWQDAWVHNLGNRDDLSDGHLSDCLQAELAIVYSDSDAGEDQWAAFPPSDVTNQEEAGVGIQGGACDGEERGEDEERQEEEIEAKLDTETGTEEQREVDPQESEGGRGSDEEQMKTRRDLFLRSPSVSSTASSTDPDRRVRLFS